MTGRLTRTAIAVAGVLLVAGCVRIPSDGPVHDARAGGVTASSDQVSFAPRLPQPGESGIEIVDGFLQAMLASPMSATVAKEYLTETASSRWRPEEGYVTYGSKQIVGTGNDLRVVLGGVNRFDARGAWVGAPPDGRLELDLPIEPGRLGFRITQAPDDLVVSDDWFQQQTEPLSIYYFDPTARVMVPEPVFVPQGVQAPTLLVRALLAGPTDSRVERTFLPVGTRLRLSVTVSPNGVADVPLTGDSRGLDPASFPRAAAQLAWTLGQVTGISDVRVTFDGQPAGQGTSLPAFDVDTGSEYDPTGLYAGGQLYGLRQGRVVRVLGDSVEQLGGALGQRAYGLRQIAVDLEGSRVAGVADEGRQMLLSSVAGTSSTGSTGHSGGAGDSGGAGGTSSPGTAPTVEAPRLVLRGSDLLRPAWDTSGRLWMVDRTTSGARVWVLDDGRLTPVDVPGVTGRAVVRFLVSRDGTRLVAAIRGRGSDRIVESRLYPGVATDAPPRATPARPIVAPTEPALRVRDLGWRTSTSVSYLHAVAGDRLELRSAIVDGSPERFDPTAIPGSFPGTDRLLVTSPRDTEAVYVGGDGHYQPTGSPGDPVPDGVDALTYVG